MNLKTEFKITIPTPNGFLGRRCSGDGCGKYFQIHKSSINNELICPYCGEKNRIESMWTESQANYARDVVAEDAMLHITSELQKTFKGLEKYNSSNGMIKFKASSIPYRKKYVSAPVENKMDSEMVCPECDGKFQVYGIFGYCPLCRYENIKIYDANLAIIVKEIDAASNNQRALRHAYGDLVSTFENFCKKYSQSNTSVNFQSLRNAKQHFKKQNSIDIYKSLSDLEKTKIKRVFMKRHVYMHSEGLISDQYVKEVPEDIVLLGQKAVLSKDELVEGADILRKIINNMVN